MSHPTTTEAMHCSACAARRMAAVEQCQLHGRAHPAVHDSDCPGSSPYANLPPDFYCACIARIDRHSGTRGTPVYMATDAAVPLGWINYVTESPYFNMAMSLGTSLFETVTADASIEVPQIQTVTLRQMRPLPGMVFWVLEDNPARLFQCAGPHFTPNPANRYVRREQDNAACRELYTTSPAAPGTVQRNPARSSSPLRPIEDWSADAETVLAEHRAKWLKKDRLPDARTGPAPVPAAAGDEFGEPVEVARPEPLAPPPSFLPAMRRA